MENIEQRGTSEFPTLSEIWAPYSGLHTKHFNPHEIPSIEYSLEGRCLTAKDSGEEGSIGAALCLQSRTREPVLTSTQLFKKSTPF